MSSDTGNEKNEKTAENINEEEDDFDSKDPKKRQLPGYVKGKKNTRRRLSISSVNDDDPGENEDIQRSLREMQENEERFQHKKKNLDIDADSEEEEEDEDDQDIKKDDTITTTTTTTPTADSPTTTTTASPTTTSPTTTSPTTTSPSKDEAKTDDKADHKDPKKDDKNEDKIVNIRHIHDEDFMTRNINRRSSVAGTRAMHYQDKFEKKCVKIKGSIEGLNKNGIGYVCRKGLKPESPNQDDFIIMMMENLALYAIFDGHGPYGHDVSNFVQKELPYMIIKDQDFLYKPDEVFKNAFLRIHEIIDFNSREYLRTLSHIQQNDCENITLLTVDGKAAKVIDLNDPLGRLSIQNVNPKERKSYINDSDDSDTDLIYTINEKGERVKKKKKLFFDSTMSGTTATVMVHMFREKKLYVAYVGDSRAVIGKLKKNDDRKLVAHDLTVDHKPNAVHEEMRILAAGGEVLKLEGDIPYRVFIKNKFYPGLAMSRAIGDSIGHKIGVISEPDFLEIDLNDDEDILVLICSDGVWEFITSQEAIDLIYKYGYVNVQEAVELLAKEAWNRWLDEEDNVVDDITIQAIYLSPKMKDRTDFEIPPKNVPMNQPGARERREKERKERERKERERLRKEREQKEKEQNEQQVST